MLLRVKKKYYHFIATIRFDKILFATRTLSYKRFRHFSLNVIVESLLHSIFFAAKWGMVHFATLTANTENMLFTQKGIGIKNIIIVNFVITSYHDIFKHSGLRHVNKRSSYPGTTLYSQNGQDSIPKKKQRRYKMPCVKQFDLEYLQFQLP